MMVFDNHQTIDAPLTLTIDSALQSDPEHDFVSQELPSPSLAQSYESTINLFGKFRQQILSLRFSSAIT